MRRTLSGLLALLLPACAAPEPQAAPSAAAAVPASAPAPSTSPETDLETFARPLGWPHDESWVALGIEHSQVTQSARRIWFDKDAVTTALLEHAGGTGFDAAPLIFPPGTVFVAEQLEADGRPFDTEVLITREGSTPDFLLFDREGARSRAEVPGSCIACHEGDAFFQPMMSFPREPAANSVALDDSWRDVELARRFLEAYQRSDHVFGPYATMWLSKLRAEHQSGTLSAPDRERFETLRERYAELVR